MLMDLKYAVYPGTITLDNGDVETFTAGQLATLYNVADEDYLIVTPTYKFLPGVDEVSYVHLKPLSDGKYYDAKVRYNDSNEEYWGPDFDGKAGGKWVQPVQHEDDDI